MNSATLRPAHRSNRSVTTVVVEPMAMIPADPAAVTAYLGSALAFATKNTSATVTEALLGSLEGVAGEVIGASVCFLRLDSVTKATGAEARQVLAAAWEASKAA